MSQSIYWWWVAFSAGFAFFYAPRAQASDSAANPQMARLAKMLAGETI
jgi:hypothetical protein